MTILNTYFYYKPSMATVIVALLGVVCLICSAWFWHKMFFKTKIKRKVICISLIVAAVVLVWGSGYLMNRHTVVECTVDQTYSAVELYDAYSIQDKRGDIWVLEKRQKKQEAIVNYED